MVGAADRQSPGLDAQLDAHQRQSPVPGRARQARLQSGQGVMDWNPRSDLLHDPTWQRGYARLGERDLSFDAWMYNHQLPAFRTVAAAHPETAWCCAMGTPWALEAHTADSPTRSATTSRRGGETT